MLKFECKVSNQSKWYNLSEKVWNDQKIEIWVQNVKSIRRLKFEWKVEIKMLKFEWKLGIDRNVEMWGLRLEKDQSVSISVQNVKVNKVLKFQCKKKKNVKIMQFECTNRN